MSRCTSDRYRPLWYVELALVYMTLYGRLVEPLEVGKISNNNIIHSWDTTNILKTQKLDQIDQNDF